MHLVERYHTLIFINFQCNQTTNYYIFLRIIGILRTLLLLNGNRQSFEYKKAYNKQDIEMIYKVQLI